MATHPSSSFPSLCEDVKAILPASLSRDSWYIAIAPALIACGKPNEIGQLFHQFISDKASYPGVVVSGDREYISKRLRDVLMKTWTLTGIPPVVIAFSSLASAESSDPATEAEKSTLNSSWQDLDITPSGPIYERGTARLEQGYQKNLTPIFSTWGSHRADLEYLEKSIIYGIFLSDLSVLSSVEAQILSCVAILCSGYSGPAMWHLRGLRRLGLSEEEVDSVREAAVKVAVWCGKDEAEVRQWPQCKDIPKEDL